MRNLTEIVFHCSATRLDWYADKTFEEQIAEMRRWHVVDNKWSNIGYHFAIARKGRTLPARPLTQTGAHVKGHNTGTVGVCLIGGHGSDAFDAFDANFTKQQAAAASKLIRELVKQYPSIVKISGHNDYAAKACPGFQVEGYFNRAGWIAN
jgi:N-acetylmuramoyl-L-alanine amidase